MNGNISLGFGDSIQFEDSVQFDDSIARVKPDNLYSGFKTTVYIPNHTQHTKLHFNLHHETFKQIVRLWLFV